LKKDTIHRISIFKLKTKLTEKKWRLVTKHKPKMLKTALNLNLRLSNKNTNY
jgi:hypothetical protein